MKSFQNLKEFKIAGVFDAFSMECIGDECELILPTPDNWHEILEKSTPDLLMVESAWQGNMGSWENKIAQYPNKGSKLQDMVAYCNKKNIPTVFWNKEDPVFFNAFIGSAKLFDYIFTTDASIIHRYKIITNKNNVFVMPFAAQPKIHNPIEILDRSNKIVYSGSYYSRRYYSRMRDFNRLVSVCKDYGLVIYDRNYSNNLPQFSFPKHMNKYIVGDLKVEDLYIANKGYKFSINVNSVKHSPTMFSRRVFEMIASNTPIISSWSKGIEKIFGNLVINSDNIQEVGEKLDTLYKDNRLYNLYRLRGLRFVMEQHTYEKRLLNMLSMVGFNINTSIPGVTIIVNINNNELALKQAKETIKRWHYPQKQIIILHKGLQLDDKDNKYLNLDQTDQKDLLDNIKYNRVIYLGQTSYYGENYLKDLILATQYCDQKIIGKGNYYTIEKGEMQLITNGKAYNKALQMGLERCLFSKKLLEDKRLFTAVLENEFHFDLGQLNIPMFSIDEFNYISHYKSINDEKYLQLIDDSLNPHLNSFLHSKEEKSLKETIGNIRGFWYSLSKLWDKIWLSLTKNQYHKFWMYQRKTIEFGKKIVIKIRSFWRRQID